MKTVMSSFRFFLPVPDMNRKGTLALNKIFFILAICLLTLMGCLMESQEPVGETPASINPRDWEGTWVWLAEKNGTCIPQIVDALKGILLMKVSWWDEKKKREDSATVVLHLRQSGDWLFANWLFAMDKTFWWGRIGNWAMEDGGRVIVFWLPDEGELSRLTKGGELPEVLVEEKAEKKRILGPLLPRHYQVLGDHEQEIFFKGNKPLVLMRLAKQ